MNTTGIRTGEFATLTFHVVAGTPTSSDFSIATGARIVDATNIPAPIAGISAMILPQVDAQAVPALSPYALVGGIVILAGLVRRRQLGR